MSDASGQILSGFSVFGYEQGCVWGAKSPPASVHGGDGLNWVNARHEILTDGVGSKVLCLGPKPTLLWPGIRGDSQLRNTRFGRDLRQRFLRSRRPVLHRRDVRMRLKCYPPALLSCKV